MSRKFRSKTLRTPLRRKESYLDLVKKTKYVRMSIGEKINQKEFMSQWCLDMLDRKEKGDEKYGNYMMEIDDKKAFEELREEMLDCCNHLVMLTYRLRNKFVKRKNG